jgi:hypothetical protein
VGARGCYLVGGDLGQTTCRRKWTIWLFKKVIVCLQRRISKTRDIDRCRFQVVTISVEPAKTPTIVSFDKAHSSCVAGYLLLLQNLGW